MLKTFYYQFIDPPFIKPIQVNVKECLTVEDLIKKVATYFNITYYRLIVENQPRERLLEKITEKFVFILKLPNRRTDITFFLLKSKTIHLKNGYKLNYDEIIRSFQANQLYYSNKCVQNHIQFKIFDRELPHIEYPLLAIPSGICINVRMGCEIVTLKYGSDNFIFAENEQAIEAFKLIKKTYENCDSVSIKTNEGKLTERDSLKKSLSYEISVFYKVTFKNINDWDEALLYLDLLSNVSDAQKQLLYRLDKYENFSHSKVILYNGNMQEMNDSNQLLKNIQDFSHFFYFEIKKRSPEKVFSEKPNLELDPKFFSTPNRQTKAQYIDYSMTPEPTTKFTFNYEIGMNSKTPEQKSKSKFKNKQQININQKQSSKSKITKNQKNSIINNNSTKSNVNSNNQQKSSTKQEIVKNSSTDSFYQNLSPSEKEKNNDSPKSVIPKKLINEEEEEEFLERNENDNSSIVAANDNDNNLFVEEEEEEINSIKQESEEDFLNDHNEDQNEEEDLLNDDALNIDNNSNVSLANSVDNHSFDAFEEESD